MTIKDLIEKRKAERISAEEEATEKARRILTEEGLREQRTLDMIERALEGVTYGRGSDRISLTLQNNSISLIPIHWSSTFDGSDECRDIPYRAHGVQVWMNGRRSHNINIGWSDEESQFTERFVDFLESKQLTVFP
jgi:hypothetical protein